LRKYDERLYKKPRWLVLNKIDLVPVDERDALVTEFRRRLRTRGRLFAISAATGEGCRELAAEIARFLQAERRAEQAAASREAGPASPEELA